MTLLSVLSASTRVSVWSKLDEQFPVDYMLATQGREAGVPRSVAEELRGKPELASVLQVRRTPIKVGDRRYDIGTYHGTVTPEVVAGSTTGMSTGEVALLDYAAEELGVTVGGTVHARTDLAGTVPLRVVAVLKGENSTLPPSPLPSSRSTRTSTGCPTPV